MNGPVYPYYQPPPPPPKRGPSPAVVVLLAVGGAFALGGGACVVLGGLALLSAGDRADVAAPEGDTPGTPGVGTAPSLPGAPTATTLTETGRDEPAPAGPTPGAEGPPTAGAEPPTTGTPGGTWRCTASGSVRVCGFANACNNQMVFGNGYGKDRYLASTQAKNACESMARAKGGSTVCVVQCSARLRPAPPTPAHARARHGLSAHRSKRIFASMRCAPAARANALPAAYQCR